MTTRRPAVAGSFYPAGRDELGRLVDGLLAAARTPDAVMAAAPAGIAGILVPHAGLSFSGHVAAAAWGLGPPASAETTIVILGTNHSARWLDGVGAWDAGAWSTPLGELATDEELAASIAALGHPFVVDRDAHAAEHSIEVQLPFVVRAMRGARIVALAVSTGTGERAIEAGERLGSLIAARRAAGADVRLAISTDMAHYPPAAIGERVTEELAPHILALDPRGLARREAEISASGLAGVACGMCGIEPAVVGLAALRALRVERGVQLAAATSADVGGSPDRTVGYLAVAFPG